MALLPTKRKEGSTNLLTRLHQEIDDLFSSFFEDWEMPLSGRSRWPAIDIAENENEFIVKAEVPGCKAEDIDISVHDSRLTISGEKNTGNRKTGKRLLPP
jgi:HSP20 family protein